MGISQSPEGRHVFPRMSVLENLEMGAYQRDMRSAEYKEDLERVYTLFPAAEGARVPEGGHALRAASSRWSRWAAR